MITTTLQCHPDSPCPAIDNFSVELQQLSGNQLKICYQLTADTAALIIPDPKPALPADNLWQHTCFEAFIAAHDEPGYFEFNFSPSSEWASYAFSSYRQRLPYRCATAVKITFECAETQLVLTAVMDLPESLSGKPLQIGLTAVIEARPERLSYWALHHPLPHPDFHHREGFTLSLNAF